MSTLRSGNQFGDEPFAIMVGFPGPHSQYDPAPEFATFDPTAMPEPLSTVDEDVAMMRSDGGRTPRLGRWKASWYRANNPNPPSRTRTGSTALTTRVSSDSAPLPGLGLKGSRARARDRDPALRVDDLRWGVETGPLRRWGSPVQPEPTRRSSTIARGTPTVPSFSAVSTTCCWPR